MTTHITNEVTHYKGQCYAWDVVNEGLSDSTGYRDSIFYETIGEYYIPLAFAAAGAADPDAKLYYNEYVCAALVVPPLRLFAEHVRHSPIQGLSH